MIDPLTTGHEKAYGMVRLAGRHKSRKIPRHIAAELGHVLAAGDVHEFRLARER